MVEINIIEENGDIETFSADIEAVLRAFRAANEDVIDAE